MRCVALVRIGFCLAPLDHSAVDRKTMMVVGAGRRRQLGEGAFYLGSSKAYHVVYTYYYMSLSKDEFLIAGTSLHSHIGNSRR